jgi:hypothetical protein
MKYLCRDLPNCLNHGHAEKTLKELGKQGRIIIKTSDTDVIVLCIYFDKQMKNTSELWVGNVIQISRGH